MTVAVLESTSTSPSEGAGSLPAALQLAPCLIDQEGSSTTSSATPHDVQHKPVVPARRFGRDDLVPLLHSKIRRMAEDGPDASRTSADRVAYLIALGCVYLDADFTSVHDLMLNIPGGLYIQRSPDPDVWARELYLDAWRARDIEIANAIVMNVDAVCPDTKPMGRAQSRLSAYLRPVNSEHQFRLDLPVQLGVPHQGDLSGEFREVMAAFNAGAVPERRDRRIASEAWKDALVRVVLSEQRQVRHVLPLDPVLAEEIRVLVAAGHA